MPLPSDPDSPEDAADEHLADLLDACLRAEQMLPGSSIRIVQTAPEAMRTELEQLVQLGLRLRSMQRGMPGTVVPQGLRARIQARIEPRSWSSFVAGVVRGWVTWLLRVVRQRRVGRPG